MLDDSYRITRAYASSGVPPFAYNNWASSYAADGAATITAIARDMFGTILATSTAQPITISNKGLGTTLTSPNLSGSLSGTITWSHNLSGFTAANHYFHVDGREAPYNTGGATRTFNTTGLLNGKHVFAYHNDYYYDTPINSHQYQTDGTMREFVATVDNGHTLMAVKPDITDIRMVVGGPACSAQTGPASSACGSYQLAPVLAYTDGATAAGTFTYALKNACFPYDGFHHRYFDCVDPPSGNVATNATAATPAVSVSAGLITALAPGQSWVVITDTVSGKTAQVMVIVQQYSTVAHLGNDGTVKHAYDPDHSVMRLSAFNSGSSLTGETRAVAEFKKANFTAFEMGFFTPPHGYATFADWWAGMNTAFGGGYPWSNIGQIVNARNNTGMCVVLQGDNFLSPSTPEAINNTVSGNGGVLFSPEPLTYALQQLKSSGGVCGIEWKDEVQWGWGGNPIPDTKFTTGGLRSIVVNGSTISWDVPGHYYTWSGYTAPITVVGASTTGLNGTYTIQMKTNNGYTYGWCTLLNIYFPMQNPWLCPDPFILTTDNPRGVANGTYTASTDPNIEILEFSHVTAYAGDPTFPNDGFKRIADRARTAGVAQTWPPAASVDIAFTFNWVGPELADYTSAYGAMPGSDGQGSLSSHFGASHQAFFRAAQGTVWGLSDIALDSRTGGCSGFYWQGCEAKGYVNWQPDVPVSMNVGILPVTYTTGGRALTIDHFNGAVMTTTTPHGLRPGSYARLQIVGNSDSAMNTTNGGQWYAGVVTGANTVEVFSKTGTVTCSLSTSGTAAIRGVTHTILYGAGNSFVADGPVDVYPGEHVVVAGNAAGCNATWAIGNIGAAPDTATPYYYLNAFANSSGTGGTVYVNDDAGDFDPAYDIPGPNQRPEGIQVAAVSEALVGASAVRYYMYAREMDAMTFATKFPYDGSDMQLMINPYAMQKPATVRGAAGYYNGFMWPQPAAPFRSWRVMAQGNALLKRITPFLLQTWWPSPNLGWPWVACTVRHSSYGNLLLCINASEVSNAITVDHTKYQVGSYPVSQYRMAYPHIQTDLLSGALTTQTYTLAPGETMALLYHSSADSFVKQVPISFDLPAGTTKMAMRYTYSYPEPLGEYATAVECPSSPCSVALDLGMGDIWTQTSYLDSSNAVKKTSDIYKFN